MSVDAFGTRGAGALAVVAAVIVLGGVAVGKHIVSAEGAAVSRIAPLSPPAVQSLPGLAVQPAPLPAVTAVQPVVAHPQSELEGMMPTASVESLPRVAPGAWPAPASPAQHPALSTPLPVVAAPAPGPAAKTPRQAAVHDDAKDSPEIEKSLSESAAAPVVAPAAVEEDPLVKAVRDDIQEEEARHR
jgi:hypothetical protein